MKIASYTKYLGVQFGPGASEALVWKEAVAKWWARSFDIPKSESPTSVSLLLYNSTALSTLSYLAQLFPMDREALLKEKFAIHK
eukprot:9152872-Pyramimonas_sp.AAC.1